MNIQQAPKDNPFPLFEDWFTAAKENDPVYYCGMSIATVNAMGRPSNRVVLLKEYDANGFVFYTNYNSRKGQELENNPYISATFWWSEFQRQIRIEGKVEKVSQQRSSAYFYSRPEGSQLAAIASQQSATIESLAALEQNFEKVTKTYSNKPIEKPEHWGGYRIKPDSIEYWQGLEHRLHHRLLYTHKEGRWSTQYLQP